MRQREVTHWIDVSVTARHGMPHWPDNRPIVLERVMDLGRGDDCNVSHLAMGVHSGTHMDGPVRFLHQAPGLDEMPLTATMGEARAILRPVGGPAPGQAARAEAAR
jgi:arylformamidase